MCNLMEHTDIYINGNFSERSWWFGNAQAIRAEALKAGHEVTLVHFTKDGREIVMNKK